MNGGLAAATLQKDPLPLGARKDILVVQTRLMTRPALLPHMFLRMCPSPGVWCSRGASRAAAGTP
jgi:hypothetical protein